MKYWKLIIPAGLLVLTGLLLSFARFDDDVIQKIATQLGKWSAGHPQEKVYLQLDKPYYAIGDDIWFKAYVVTGNHQLSAISNLLNVELIDGRDSVTKAIRVLVTQGLAWGDFKLPDSLAEGNYRIRAYTNLMRNYGDEYFFDKTIAVGNAISNTVITKASYTYSTQNNQQKVNAAINYADFTGKPYAGKEVTYEVQLGSKQNIKGHGNTDDAGNLSFSFVNNTPGAAKSGIIITGIRVGPKQTITKIVPIKSVSGKVDIQFFPESGYLVNGVRNRVAFKAVGPDGLGVDATGSVADNQGTEVAKITTQHLGMGMFTFAPDSGKTYTARLTYADGSEGTINLPAALNNGYVMSIYNNEETDLSLRLWVSPATLRANMNAEVNIVAQANGTVVYAAKTKLQSVLFATKIPKSKFPTGIVQFTLFSSTGQPLNERVVFIQNPDQLKLNIATAKQSYAPREKVKLDIAARDKDGKPVLGNFSVAVIDESKVTVDEDGESTILSSLLLTSDIKGYIEKPNYYFNNVSDKTRADLDLLMMTQGYRRFTWKQVMAGDYPPLAFKPEKSIAIEGHLKTPGGKPIPNGKVSLFSSKGSFMLDTVTDAQGLFAFKDLVFGDSVRFIIQARNQKDRKNVELVLDNVTRQAVSKNKNEPDVEVNVDAGMGYYLRNSKNQYDDLLSLGLINKPNMLREVSIVDKKKPLVEHSENLNGPGNADQIYTIEDFQTCPTIEICLMNRMLGVIFQGGVPYSTRTPTKPMQIIVDGIYVTNDVLSSLDPSNVQSVEVLRSVGYTAIYGLYGDAGLLIVTTRRGGGPTTYNSYTPYIVTYKPLGYFVAREFYSPQYDSPKTNAKIADLRSTIYWKPNVFTDVNGTKSVEYFNADGKGTYRAVVEGIDNDGNIARGVFRYKVE